MGDLTSQRHNYKHHGILDIKELFSTANPTHRSDAPHYSLPEISACGVLASSQSKIPQSVPPPCLYLWRIIFCVVPAPLLFRPDMMPSYPKGLRFIMCFVNLELHKVAGNVF